jgi:hypothetical protein
MAGMFGWLPNICHAEHSPCRLPYQPPDNNIFLSGQTSHQQPASSTFLSKRISTCHQPPTKRVLLFRCHNYVPPQNLGKL